MTKTTELSTPNSCLNKALDEEMLFVLLSRDPSAPAAIRAWVTDRVRRGLNGPNDEQIQEAEACLRTMEAQRAGVREKLETLKANTERK